MLNEIKIQEKYQAIVVNTNDPSKLGRVTVRIIGIHSLKKNELPDDKLPWVMVRTQPGAFVQYEIGDLVEIEFWNGNSDYPIVVGKYTGIASVIVDGYSNSFTTREYAEKVYGVLPAWPEGTTRKREGETVIPGRASGNLTGSPTKVANENKEGACDISSAMKINIGNLKLQISGAIQWIKDKLKSFFDGFKENAYIHSIQLEIKKWVMKLKNLQKFIKLVDDVLLAVKAALDAAQKIIAWIVSLPALFAKALNECMQEFMDSINEALSSSFGSISGADGTPLALAADVKSLVDTTTDTVNQVAEAAQNVEDVAGGIRNIKNTIEAAA